jgi:hypothetical protein
LLALRGWQAFALNMTTRLKVLVACEFSGIVREAFNRLGHDATSCDLLETEIPGDHIRHDAIDVLESEDWDLVIAHPPCTYLTNSGVRWLYGKKGGSKVRDLARWQLMHEGADFFARFYQADSPRVCVENPVMHGHASDYLAAKGVPAFSQSVQPYQFGHLETKRTCLWLRGLPPLVGTEDVEKAMRALPKSQTNLVHLASPGPDRWLMRSRTYPGIAEAMAHQWGGRVTSKSFPVLKPDALNPQAGNTPAPLALGIPLTPDKK